MGRIEGPAHADHVLKVIAGNEAASSALAASWRRSGALHALDPASRAPSQRLPEEEIARSRDRMGSLLIAAQASIDRLFLAVGGVGCSVMLADPSGVIVERRGAPCDDYALIAPDCGPAPSGARNARAPTASAPASSSSVR